MGAAHSVVAKVLSQAASRGADSAICHRGHREHGGGSVEIAERECVLFGYERYEVVVRAIAI